MMKSVLIYGVLFWVLGCYKAAGQEAIGLYDLHYTLETDLSTPKGRNFAWDFQPCRGIRRIKFAPSLVKHSPALFQALADSHPTYQP